MEKRLYRKMAWSSRVDRITWDSSNWKPAKWSDLEGACKARSLDYGEVRASVKTGANNIVGAFTYAAMAPGDWRLKQQERENAERAARYGL